MAKILLAFIALIFNGFGVLMTVIALLQDPAEIPGTLTKCGIVAMAWVMLSLPINFLFFAFGPILKAILG